MDDLKVKEYYVLVLGFWKWFKKYLTREDIGSDTYWDDLYDESVDIMGKYHASNFAQDIVIAGIKEIRAISSNTKQNQGEV